MFLLCETNKQEATTLQGRIQHWIIPTQWQTSGSSWGIILQTNMLRFLLRLSELRSQVYRKFLTYRYDTVW